jgi:KDO2-lipid IV(A) lauroyltransferase
MSELVEYYLFILLSQIARRLPYRAAGTIGALLGIVVFTLTGFRRKITLDNLTQAFPEMSGKELRRVARGAYRNYGIAVVEMLWSLGASEENLAGKVRLRNADCMLTAIRARKGTLLLSAHFGSWELLVSAMRLRLGEPFVMIAQHQRNGRIDAFIEDARCRFGNTAVSMGPVSVRRVLDALGAGKVVCILGDQAASKESLFIDFFGRPAATHRGVAVFSLKTGAPIVMALLLRQEDGTYDAVFEEVDRTGLDAYTEENVVELTRRHAALLERYIREFPDHWLWMHKRWKHLDHYESHRTEKTSGERVAQRI